MSGGSNDLSSVACALVPAGMVPAGVKGKCAHIDENHADEFWFCKIPMMSRLRNINGI
jgi:hypothetical protein